MSEMVERVARALCIADGELPEAFHTKAAYEAQDRDGVMLTDAAFPLWMRYRQAARAAIEAMREPNMAMVVALGQAIQKPGAAQGVVICDPGLVAHAWFRMIDAALSDGAT